MSAWMVSEAHIDVIAQAAHKEDDRIDPTEVGRVLARENVRSLMHRYPNDYEEMTWDPETYTYHEPARAWSPGALAKVLDCYDYQACEAGDFDTTEAGRIVNGIRAGLLSALPGYESAPWGVEDGRGPVPPLSVFAV